MLNIIVRSSKKKKIITYTRFACIIKKRRIVDAFLFPIRIEEVETRDCVNSETCSRIL